MRDRDLAVLVATLLLIRHLVLDLDGAGTRFDHLSSQQVRGLRVTEARINVGDDRYDVRREILDAVLHVAFEDRIAFFARFVERRVPGQDHVRAARDPHPGRVAQDSPLGEHTKLFEECRGVDDHPRPDQVRGAGVQDARGHDVHLMLVGDGSEQTSLVERCSTARMTGRVHFVGRQTDVGAYFSSMDIYVNSSISEGTSLSIMEAMASGLPLVVTDAGDNARLVNGSTGDT